jgi:hypothetical protein
VYRVAVTGEGGLHGTTEGLRFDGKEPPGPLIARLEERFAIHGSVRTPEGPAALASVELVHEEPSGRRLQRLFGAIVPAPHRVALEAVTGPDGRFALNDVPPGTYRLHARKAGLAGHLSSPFTLPWTGEFLIVLRRAASLRGTLRGGEGSPDANVPLVLTRGDDPARVAWTDAEGRFAFEGLPPGADYRLRVGDPTRARAEPVDLEEVPIDGSGPAGAPAWEAGLAWTLAIDEGAQVTFHPARERSPAGGEAAAAGIALARAKDEPDAGGPVPATYPPPGGGDPVPEAEGAEPAAGAEPESAAAPAPATHRVRFDMVDALTSRPFAGACDVELTPRDAARGGARVTQSGVTPIAIDGLPAGTYIARVRARGLLHWEGEVVLEGDRAQTVPIDEGEDIAFQLLVAEGEEFRGRAEVILWKGGREVYRAFEEIGGSVTVPTAGPGDYEILVRSQDRRANVTFTLTRGEVENEDGDGDN